MIHTAKRSANAQAPHIDVSRHGPPQDPAVLTYAQILVSS
jgi:hypothetical protein